VKTKYRPVADMALLALKACLALAWTATFAAAYAAALGRDGGQGGVLGLDPMLLVLTAIISTLSGGTALAWRINDLMLKEDERVAAQGGERRPFVRPWLFAGAHMGGSWMAGTLLFLFARAGDWGVWHTLAGVLIASFAGAKFIELAAERWLAVVRLPVPKGEPS
jgi:hypothetical protein